MRVGPCVEEISYVVIMIRPSLVSTGVPLGHHLRRVEECTAIVHLLPLDAIPLFGLLLSHDSVAVAEALAELFQYSLLVGFVQLGMLLHEEDTRARLLCKG
jgi:hypothetical protein